MRSRISKWTVDQLRPGQSIADLDVQGFSARCLPSGAVSFDLRYRTATGERRRYSLGVLGKVTADQARSLAEKHLDDLAKNIDPAVQRERQRGTTINAVLDNYIDRVLNTKRTAPAQISAFDRLVRPEIGTRTIYDLQRKEIAAMMDTIEDANGRVMADRALAYLRAALNWQQARDDNFVNPIVRGMQRTSPKELERDRVLTDDEIKAIWKATAKDVFGALVRFLLLTAARRDEARRMTWQEIKGSDWTLPAARNKAKVDLVRPLSKAAQDVLKARPHKSDYVFVGPRGVRAVGDGNGGKERLDQASGVTGWRLHDLRRTASTLMSRARVLPDYKERCLGHVIGGIRGKYDKWEFIDEKREAYEKLAKLVGEITR
jgi:integrase